MIWGLYEQWEELRSLHRCESTLVLQRKRPTVRESNWISCACITSILSLTRSLSQHGNMQHQLQVPPSNSLGELEHALLKNSRGWHCTPIRQYMDWINLNLVPSTSTSRTDDVIEIKLQVDTYFITSSLAKILSRHVNHLLSCIIMIPKWNAPSRQMNRYLIIH